MKKYIYLTLFTIFLLLNSCKKNSCENNYPSYCDTQNLGITTFHKLSFPGYGSRNRWTWTKHNDTIEIVGPAPHLKKYYHFYFKKNTNHCIDLLFCRVVEYDYNDIVQDIDTGELIQSGYTVTDYYNQELKLQDYIEDELLVGQIMEKKFWMEFTIDINYIVNDEYLEYFPDKVIYNVEN